MVQEVRAANPDPQLFHSGNKRGAGPVVAMLLMVIVVLPVLVRVTDLTADSVCTFSEPKARLVADSFNVGAVVVWAPVPVRVMV
jgi:fructose 1,6-bisphosphatase